MQATPFHPDTEILPADFTPEMAGLMIHIPTAEGHRLWDALPYISALLFLALVVFCWLVAAAAIPPTAVVGVKFKGEISYRVPLPISAFSEISRTVSVELPVKATGEIEVPDGYATGKIRFTSVESSPVSYGKDAVIARVGEVQYRLVKPLTIPGFGNGPGTVDGLIAADHPGPIGNSSGLGNFLITPSIRVQSLGAISGGGVKSVSVISETDISELRKSLEIAISEKAQEVVRGETPAGYFTLNAYEISPLNFTPPTIGQEISGQKGKAIAGVKWKVFHPEILLRDLALPTDSPSLGQPEFREINETSSTLIYTRKVNPAPVLEMLEYWEGGKREFGGLVSYLRSLPEVAEITVPDLKDFRGFYLKLQVQS